MGFLITRRKSPENAPDVTQKGPINAINAQNIEVKAENVFLRVDTYPIKPYIYNMKGRNKYMKKKKDKVQEAINKYGIKFHSFMLDLDHQIKNDKAFKNIKGNMFAGICMAMRRDINSFLRFARKQ